MSAACGCDTAHGCATDHRLTEIEDRLCEEIATAFRDRLSQEVVRADVARRMVELVASKRLEYGK